MIIFYLGLIVTGIVLFLKPDLYAKVMRELNSYKGIKTSDNKGMVTGSRIVAGTLIALGIILYLYG